MCEDYGELVVDLSDLENDIEFFEKVLAILGQDNDTENNDIYKYQNTK